MRAKGKLGVADLTYLAEDLGQRDPPPVRYLAALVGHRDPVVREGAVYGLAYAVSRDDRARPVLERVAEIDANEWVRNAAREALEP